MTTQTTETRIERIAEGLASAITDKVFVHMPNVIQKGLNHDYIKNALVDFALEIKRATQEGSF
jgi:hypothetical protein